MRAPPLRRMARGFSMIELMVAMLISLIGVMIIFQVFEVSEGIKRTATSGGDAQQNGTISLYVMEYDLRNAGMGFNDTPYAGCNIIGSDSSRSPNNFPVAPATMQLVPVAITPGASATAPDELTVFYGSSARNASATTLFGNMAAATNPLLVLNPYGYRTGDLVLLLEPGSGKNCALMEVTSFPTTNTLAHDSGTYTLTSGASVQSRFNPAAGMGVVYGGANTAAAARVFNLGNLYDANNSTLPIYNTYRIVSNALTVSNGFVVSGGAPTVNSIADNIVHMRVRYGVDDGINDGTVPYSTVFTAGDGIVDRYISTAPNWQRLIAVRIALVARSALAEKPSAGAGAPCDTTTAAPTWTGGTFDLSADANWQCYRYRVFETTVPVRNWIWKST